MNSDEILTFLEGTRWDGADGVLLTGDASARRYLRLTGGPRPALVMVAPPDTCGPLAPFLAMTEHLRERDLRAPVIFKSDPEQGLILLEDFGDDLLARCATADPSREEVFYERACDVLVVLNASPVLDLPRLRPVELAEMLEPLFTYYAPGFTGGQAVINRLKDLLLALPDWRETLALRDYHAENLILLDDGQGAQSVGLIDYQDAVLTHPAYDLASLLQDARRQVPRHVQNAILARFRAATGLTDRAFLTGYRLVALQRNLRILGIFARLSRMRPEGRYERFQPLVWRHVQDMLTTPDGAPLAPLLTDLPRPEQDA